MQVVAGQRVEDDRLVQAVEELRAEGALQCVFDGCAHALPLRLVPRLAAPEADAGAPANVPRPQVAGHDDDGVAEVHRVAVAVR